MTSVAMTRAAQPLPATRRSKRMTPARWGLYAFIFITALYFLLPLYVMVVTSLKPMAEIRQGNLLALPAAPSIDAWVKAWTSACTGLTCQGIKVGFLNSLRILVPSVVISILVGSLTGYALSLWRVRGANIVFIYPLVRAFSFTGLGQSLSTIVIIHTIFGLPTMTLLFRNYFASLPVELFKAARVDGAGFYQIYARIMMPMATPMIVVAVILQTTGIWNDFILGLVFAGRDNLPMTVQLNNIVNSTQGERAYNVDMAATLLTALLPLAVYFGSGRWFVRGIAAGAVKG
jgi:glucose/mannose transport system permease protein